MRCQLVSSKTYYHILQVSRDMDHPYGNQSRAALPIKLIFLSNNMEKQGIFATTVHICNNNKKINFCTSALEIQPCIAALEINHESGQALSY